MQPRNSIVSNQNNDNFFSKKSQCSDEIDKVAVKKDVQENPDLQKYIHNLLDDTDMDAEAINSRINKSKILNVFFRISTNNLF